MLRPCQSSRNRYLQLIIELLIRTLQVDVSHNKDTNTLLKINKIYLWKSNTQNTNIAVQFRWILVFFWESKSSRFSTILAWQTNRVFLLFGGVWTSIKSCSKDDEVIRVTDNGTRTNDISTVFTSSINQSQNSKNNRRLPNQYRTLNQFSETTLGKDRNCLSNSYNN